MRAALLVLAGCGRLNFSPLDSETDAMLDPPIVGVPCAAEDFDGGTPGTLQGLEWQVVDGAGPDGSPAFVTTSSTYTYVPSIGFASVLDLQVDVQLADVAMGQVGIVMLQQSFSDPSLGVGLWAISSMSADFLNLGPGSMQLDSAPPVLSGAWHRIRARYTGDAYEIYVDGALHLRAANLTIAPMFEILMNLSGGGRVDNLSIHCTRI